MYQNCCKKCGSIALHTEVKGNNTGLYCDDCGAWVKWLGKDELRAYEYTQKQKLPKTNCNISMPEVKNLKDNNFRRCKGKLNIYVDGQWKTQYFDLGYFHEWGMNYEEFESEIRFAIPLALADG